MSFSSSIGAVASGAGTYAAAEQSAESINQTLDNLLNEGEALFNADKKKKKKKLDKGVKHLVGPKTYTRPSLLDQAAFAGGLHHAVTGAYTKGYLKAALNSLPEVISRGGKHTTYGKIPKFGGARVVKSVATPHFEPVKEILSKNMFKYPSVHHAAEKMADITSKSLEEMVASAIDVDHSMDVKKEILGDKLPDNPLLSVKYFAMDEDNVYRAPFGLTENLAAIMSDTNANQGELRTAIDTGNFAGFDQSVLQRIENPDVVYPTAYEIFSNHADTIKQTVSKSEAHIYTNPPKSGKDFKAFNNQFGKELTGKPPRYDYADQELVYEAKRMNPEMSLDDIRESIEKENSVLRKKAAASLQEKDDIEYENKRLFLKAHKNDMLRLVNIIKHARKDNEGIMEAVEDLNSDELKIVGMMLKHIEEKYPADRGAVDGLIENRIKGRIGAVKMYEKSKNDVVSAHGHIKKINKIVDDYVNSTTNEKLKNRLVEDARAAIEDNENNFASEFVVQKTKEDKEWLLVHNKKYMSDATYKKYEDELALLPEDGPKVVYEEEPEAVPGLVADKLLTEEPVEAWNVTHPEAEIVNAMYVEPTGVAVATVEELDEGNDFFGERPKTETL